MTFVSILAIESGREVAKGKVLRSGRRISFWCLVDIATDRSAEVKRVVDGFGLSER